ncbi:DNA alkylation repair protein [Arcticibacterium luteifluviistationis]|uniref:DNA alkylation repair protein n=1 Tax=Arcticibacterium luteifluviistationis TaxID=1784714 RepID=A0A2Z4GHC6_9BACT|nr:DNA alkylation repair protein [Arcticibacterium luteifluviistationis]AWW00425.1 DNA alkylation repair protein [Arcticibacterium luteifluviistationis]
MTAQDFKDSLEIIGQEYSGAIPKKELFSLAKEFQNMSLEEVVSLLKSKNDDHRLGAVSVLDWKARDKKTTEKEKYEAFKTYLTHHEYINNWGMVDRAAPYVVGGYLFGKDKTPLYDLAKSQNPMERRTAIVSTYYFIRKNEIDDTFKIAEILVNDKEHFVQTAVGSWIREAGKRDEERLKLFLDKHAATMSRVTLRFAIEKFNPELRKYYLGLAK